MYVTNGWFTFVQIRVLPKKGLQCRVECLFYAASPDVLRKLQILTKWGKSVGPLGAEEVCEICSVDLDCGYISSAMKL